MEQDDYVEGLTGEEIINDILDQVEAKLRGDCNLRETDAYTGGYEGSIEIHLQLHGLDTAEIKQKVIVGAPASATYTGANEQSGELKETTVDVRVDIPLEERLNVVRERSDQDVPTLSKNEDGATVVKKRHYARRNAESNSK